MKKRVIFVTSHPIQYQAPVFRRLAVMPDLEFSVLFAMVPDAKTQGSGFGMEFSWDVPLLSGYDYGVLDNVSRHPGVTHFTGCDTPGVMEVLSSRRPDAVVVNGWVVKTCLQTVWACKRLGIPCLVRGEANDLRRRPGWKRVIQRFLVSRYSACLYIGEQNRRFYRARGIADDQLFPAPYCVDNELFKEQSEALEGEVANLRTKWSIPAGAVCFLFCGKFEPKKHPLELLEAFRLASVSCPNLHLLMVGDGELRAACEAFALRHSLLVTFGGFLNQSEIVQAYVASDCLVLSSDAGETWGLVVNEAMACGRPAVVSHLAGCAADLIVPGVNGEAFEFGDWPALGALLSRLGADRARLGVMGVKAREHIRGWSPLIAAKGIRDAVFSVSM